MNLSKEQLSDIIVGIYDVNVSLDRYNHPYLTAKAVNQTTSFNIIKFGLLDTEHFVNYEVYKLSGIYSSYTDKPSTLQVTSYKKLTDFTLDQILYKQFSDDDIWAAMLNIDNFIITIKDLTLKSLLVQILFDIGIYNTLDSTDINRLQDFKNSQAYKLGGTLNDFYKGVGGLLIYISDLLKVLLCKQELYQTLDFTCLKAACVVTFLGKLQYYNFNVFQQYVSHRGTLWTVNQLTQLALESYKMDQYKVYVEVIQDLLQYATIISTTTTNSLNEQSLSTKAIEDYTMQKIYNQLPCCNNFNYESFTLQATILKETLFEVFRYRKLKQQS